jgi:hypothetical protein
MALRLMQRVVGFQSGLGQLALRFFARLWLNPSMPRLRSRNRKNGLLSAYPGTSVGDRAMCASAVWFVLLQGRCYTLNGDKNMTGSDVLTWVRKTPFEPFRLRLNSGRTFEVRHPEMIQVSFTSAVIFTHRGPPPDLYEDMQMIGLQLVEAIEPLEPASSKQK